MDIIIIGLCTMAGIGVGVGLTRLGLGLIVDAIRPESPPASRRAQQR